MTTTVASKPVAPPAPSAVPAKILFQGLIAIDKIDVGNNFRKNFDDLEMSQMTASVKANGVEQPILLRPNGARYHLVAGARRLRASVANKLTQIPAIVKELSEDRALVSHAIENLQRKGLEPIEEARGLKTMIDKNKSSLEDLTKLIDKSLSYVTRAVRLLELPAMVLQGIEARKLTTAHGHALLCVPKERREEFVKYCFKNDWDTNELPTAKRLREHIEEEIGCDLGAASFPKDQPYAGEIACAACPNNSGNHGVLFEGAQKGQCMLAACFNKKRAQYGADKLAQAQKAYPGATAVSANNDYVREGYTVRGFDVVGKYGTKAAAAVKGGKVNPDVAVIVKEDEVWIGKRVKAAASSTGRSASSGSGGGSRGETAQQQFTRKQTERNILDAIAAASGKIEKKHWVAIVVQLYNANVPKHVLETAGIDFAGSSGYGNVLRKALEPLTVEKLQVMAVQVALWPQGRGFYERGWHDDKLRSIGMDAPKVIAKAKEAAAATWKAKKAAKK